MAPVFGIVVGVAVLAIIAYQFKTEIKCSAVAAAIQASLYSPVYFGAALLMDGISGDRPAMDIDVGYWNNLQMKFIWLSRYFLQDQFMLKSWEEQVHKDIASHVTDQYQKLGLNEQSIITQVTTINWEDFDRERYFKDFVQKGVPIVIKGFPSKAVREWSPLYFAEHYPNHRIDVINTSSVMSIESTIAEFVEKSAAGEPLYLRSLSDIFDAHPELVEDVGFHTFDDVMRAQYMTSQIFMGNGRVGSGTSYHCANFNNLFFQIAGRKKWTFVDPQYEAMMYPMFNSLSMDVASFVTTVALAKPEMMKEYFPLYALAPKMVAVLEPGDVLLNPPWNWHMVENIDSSSIGVATRWFLPSGHVYQNSVHSTLQFFSTHMWKLYYTRVFNKMNNITSHKATNTPPMDDRLNFGKKGSAKAFIPRIFQDSFYSSDESKFFVAQEE